MYLATPNLRIHSDTLYHLRRMPSCRLVVEGIILSCQKLTLKLNTNLTTSIFQKSDREPETVPFWNVVVKGTNGNAIMVDNLDSSSLTKLILLQRTD